MFIPVISGLIERRILVNYRIQPDVLSRYLPPPFRPQLIHGTGLAGICLIRLRHVRPRFLPTFLGFSSENAAHRIAVEWHLNGETQTGVFVPRRDTSSKLNTWLGGRFFPGLHNQADFRVREQAGHFQVELTSDYRKTHILVKARVTDELPGSSIFQSLSEASQFFEQGSVGYSVSTTPGRYEGLELRSFNWRIQPLELDQVTSSFFENRELFPVGSVEFDSAFLMQGIEHEWHARECLDPAEET